MNALKEDYKLCAAIDFGTTYCGVVSSSRSSPNKIYTRQDNKGDSATSLQEPTTVLLNPDRIFCKFGTEAEKEYERLVLHNEHHDYFLFRKFKMSLHSRVGLLVNFEEHAYHDHAVYSKSTNMKI